MLSDNLSINKEYSIMDSGVCLCDMDAVDSCDKKHTETSIVIDDKSINGAICRYSIDSGIANEDKRKCWICWDEDENLIRTCYGCKDPDLQYAHQHCIDQYISNILTLRNESATVLDDLLPYVSLAAIRNSNFFDCREESNSFNWNTKFQCTSVECSRCADFYNIFAEPVNPFKVLHYDPIFRILVYLMIFCYVILLFCCLTLIIQADIYAEAVLKNNPHATIETQTLKLESFFIPKGMGIKQWAFNILFLYSILFVFMSRFIWTSLAGYYNIRVYESTECSKRE